MNLSDIEYFVERRKVANRIFEVFLADLKEHIKYLKREDKSGYKNLYKRLDTEPSQVLIEVYRAIFKNTEEYTVDASDFLLDAYIQAFVERFRTLHVQLKDYR